MSWKEEILLDPSGNKRFSFAINNNSIIKIFGNPQTIWVCSVFHKKNYTNDLNIKNSIRFFEADLEVAKIKCLIKASELGWKIKYIQL